MIPDNKYLVTCVSSFILLKALPAFFLDVVRVVDSRVVASEARV
jgi:hypothetical protein